MQTVLLCARGSGVRPEGGGGTADMTAPAVPCLEVFDENSQPSAEEINEYAQQIGIDPASETYLLPLAKDGLMQALPPPWKAYYDDKLKMHYFYNAETKVTQWDHPLDQVYKGLVTKARHASERGDSVLDDTYISIQDLLTYDDDDKAAEKVKSISPNDDSYSESSLEEDINVPNKKTNSENASQKKNPTTGKLSTALDKRPLPSIGSSALERKLDPLNSFALRSGESNTFPRSAQFSVDRFKNFDYGLKSDNNSNQVSKSTGASAKNPKLIKQTSEVIDLSFKPSRPEPASNEYQKPPERRGITLTGGGSMFLKSNRTNQNNPETGNFNTNDSGATARQNIPGPNDNPKGILRDRNFGDVLLKTLQPDRSEGAFKPDLDEDKKSVRFNLERHDVDVQYDYSPSPSSNSSSEILVGNNQNTVIQRRFEQINNEKLIKRRNSESSIINEVANSVKIGKLRPIHDNFRPGSQSQLKDQPIKNDSNKNEDKNSINNSPTRKLIKPNPGDFIKPNLFQKPFEKLSDILNTNSPDSESDRVLQNNSPPPTLKRRLSINLMESLDSDASADSPDKESTKLSDSIAHLSLDSGSKKGNDVVHSKATIKPTKMETVMEQENQSPDGKTNGEIQNKSEINELRLRQETELKEIKSNLQRNYDREVKETRQRLNNELIKNKNDVELALMTARQSHDQNIKEALDQLNFEYGIRKERVIEEERHRLSNELIAEKKRIEDEHISAIDRLKQEKRNELRTLSANLENENLKVINELKMQLLEKLEEEKSFLLADNKKILDKLKNDHEALCDDLRKDYRSEVELVRAQQAAHLSALREKLRRERESPRPSTALSPPSLISPRDETSYERLRCDKRLLEDKYRCLKEKYARLKSDVKISIERRNRRREQSVTTGSETERSHSNRTGPSAEKQNDNEDPTAKDCPLPTGKRSGMLTNGVVNRSRATNNDTVTPPKESRAEIDNAKAELSQNNRDLNTSLSDSASHRNNPNFLNIAGVNVRHASSPDRARGRFSNIRDRSPVGILSHKSNNYDNDNSVDVNDVSLSQSDSNPVLGPKSGKRVNIAGVPKDRHRDIVDRPKVLGKKPPKDDAGYADTTVTDYHDSSDTCTSEKRIMKESLIGRSRKKIFTRLKSASTSRLNYSISSKLNERACSPVENLRQQLRKLEELEEQFPDVSINADTTAYRLRYPFPDSGNGGMSGGELGFLRHRALVEREGIRRARAVLRRRSDLLRQKRRSSAAWQEECELTDMEVSLHRTKSVLGEKVIRLRHIEKSLKRIQDTGDPKDTKTDSNIPKPKDAENKDTTLSDISSHSSGFSSTDAQSDTNRKHAMNSTAEYEHSSEIINSLQTLNTEIRDIWQVLNSQQQMNVAKVIPIGQLLYTDIGWQLPIAASNIPNIHSLPNSIPIGVPSINIPFENVGFRHIGSVSARPQTLPPPPGSATSLVERTRDLRDWLKQQAAL